MKELYLLRHAKSSWSDPFLADHDRPLNPRGERDAPEMARRAKENTFQFDLIGCSTSLRTKQTLAAWERYFPDILSKTTYQSTLFHADTEEIEAFVVDSFTKVNRVLVITHFPGILDYQHQVCDEAMLEHIVTCGFLKIVWDEDAHHAGSRGGKLLYYDYPKSNGEAQRW
ncbi:MAG: histidine phosphatase family protein [Cyclobacteriaceae bacterium]|nr:histidine phosphatase family protein [Cyclobacteriaceae bacterium]MCH8515450.1 histidine phosphatase family protein [Cyclobacteriaceae bacterium]